MNFLSYQGKFLAYFVRIRVAENGVFFIRDIVVEVK